jgi:tRNA isopentenyl-2-thiomethyl-A-37 hydroxylase MiaE
MASAFEQYRERIEEAKANEVNDLVKLVLVGQLIEARRARRITIRQEQELQNLLDPELETKYKETLDLATIGEIDD